MIVDKEVCNEKIEKAAMIALVADVIVTAIEGMVFPNMLIQQVIVLHIVIAASALITIVGCLAGTFAYRRIEYIKDIGNFFAHDSRPSVAEPWSESASYDSQLKLKSYE